MQLNGKEYKLRERFTLKTLQDIFKYEKDSGLATTNIFEEISEGGLDKVKPMLEGWYKLIFENWDEGLSIENLTFSEVKDIRDAFLGAAVGIPKKSNAA